MISNRDISKKLLIIFTVISCVFCELLVNSYAQDNTSDLLRMEHWNIYTYKFEHTTGGDSTIVQIIQKNGHNILSHALVDLNETCSKKFSIMIRDEEKALLYHLVDEYEGSGNSKPADNEITQPQRADYILKPSFYGKNDIITATVEAINVRLQDIIDIPSSSFMHDKYEAGIANLACHLAEELLKKEKRSIPDCAKVRKIGFGKFENNVDTKYDRELSSLVKLIRSKLGHLLKGDKNFEVRPESVGLDIKILGYFVKSEDALVANVDLYDKEGNILDSIDEKIEFPIAPIAVAINIAQKLDKALH
jgi:hypothetical protein